MSTLKQILSNLKGRSVSWDVKEKTLWALGSSRSADIIFDVGEDYIKIRCQADPVRYLYVPFNGIQAIYLDK